MSRSLIKRDDTIPREKKKTNSEREFINSWLETLETSN